MRDALLAVLQGTASGILGIVTYRLRWVWLGRFALTSMAVAVYLYSPWRVRPEVCAGARRRCRPSDLLPAVVRGARPIEALMADGHALVWGPAFAGAAWVWPGGVPAWEADHVGGALVGFRALTCGALGPPQGRYVPEQGSPGSLAGGWQGRTRTARRGMTRPQMHQQPLSPAVKRSYGQALTFLPAQRMYMRRWARARQQVITTHLGQGLS